MYCSGAEMDRNLVARRTKTRRVKNRRCKKRTRMDGGDDRRAASRYFRIRLSICNK